MFKIKNFFNFFSSLIIFVIYFGGATVVSAQEVDCGTSKVSLVFRNDEGDFIPGIFFEIYTQVDDADGNPKPGKLVSSGKTDENLGRGVVNIKGEEETIYAIKAWHKKKDVGEFYFYNDLRVCGEDREVEEELSGIHFVLRDTDEKLLKNKEFSVYTQREDADGDPIKEKVDLVSTLNTSEEGEATIYVASSNRSVDGREGDYYVFEASGPNGGTYQLFDIRIGDGDTRDVEYVFSDIWIELRNDQDITFPAKTKVEIFEQNQDAKGDNVIGKKIKDIYTNDQGVVIFTFPAGYYAARLLGADNKYVYFWDLEMEDGKRSEYELSTNEEWNPVGGKCEADSNIKVVTRNLQGGYISNLKCALYEQKADVNGAVQAGVKIMEKEIDSFGQTSFKINPDPQKKYALKIYDKNENVGEFWYFNEVQFSCGEDKIIEKQLPLSRFILRNGNGELLKNYKFSLYTQKTDVDGKPVKEKKDLIGSSFLTSEKGVFDIFLSPKNDSSLGGVEKYIFSSLGPDGSVYDDYNIVVNEGEDLVFDYTFSEIVVGLENAAGEYRKGQSIIFSKQTRDLKGSYTLGAKISETKTDNSGLVKFAYPAGYYAITTKDDLGQDNIVWGIGVKNRKRSEKTIKLNLTRIKAVDIEGRVKSKGTDLVIYSLKEGDTGIFVRDKRIKSVKFSDAENVELVLRSAPYLFIVTENKMEYGKALYAEDGKLQEVLIHLNRDDEITVGQKFKLVKPINGATLGERMAGKILLQVEENGEAWYVDKKDYRRYYMRDGVTAYEMMRKFGLGISNEDIKKIPIGIDARFDGFDYDGDDVLDKMEEAIGTDMYLNDSDSDGFDDGVEIRAGYNPAGKGKMPIDLSLVDRLKGQIVLQTESRGEAWYINPKDGRRYYMKDGEAAYEIMRFLSTGITNDNLEEIEEGFVSI